MLPRKAGAASDDMNFTIIPTRESSLIKVSHLLSMMSELLSVLVGKTLSGKAGVP
jgi:hypothetical protein